jgi:AcrR family transcriptional regulator
MLPRLPVVAAIRMTKANPALHLPKTRERILSAAARLFAELGFASASMPAIAEQSGITAGAIYRHFDSKAELLLEVVRQSLRSAPVSARASEHGKIDVGALPEVAASYVAADLKQTRQLSLEVHAAASRDPSVASLLSEYLDDLKRQISEGITDAQRAGKADAGLDADLTAQLYATVILGLNHMDTLDPERVGDPKWRAFVAERVAVLLGLSPKEKP